MSDHVPAGLLDKLSLNHWYKYLLYVAGILLVLAVIVGSKIQVNAIISFSLWTIVLMIFLWMVDDILRAVVNEDNFNTALGARVTIQIFIFIIWIIVAFSTLH